MAFTGFSRETFTFLKGLARNNDKAWFDAHRDDYQGHVVEPAKAFVAALGPRLRKISKTINFEPRVNGSIFRINRDVRFSKDKSPYKTNLDLWFWEGDERGFETPGFWFRMTPKNELMLGAGMHVLQKEGLAKYRAAVVDPKKGRALAEVLAKVRGAGPYTIGGATRKKVPRGFDPEHERAPLLLHEGLYAAFEGAIPKEASTPKLVDFVEKHYAKLAPVTKWLREVL